ncbi:MAG: glycosyltransferase [Caulobacteraceae bacterium]
MVPEKRVLFISNFYPPLVVGGAEIVAHRHATAMRENGWNVRVFAGALPTSELRHGTLSTDTVDGLTVYRLVHRSMELEENFRWPLANRVLKSILTTFQPQWMLAHNLSGLGVDLVRIARAAGVRAAVTLHDHWGHCFKGTRLRNDGQLCGDPDECHLCRPTFFSNEQTLPIRLRRDFVAHRLDAADVLISPSQSLASMYIAAGFGSDRIVVQSNGIDLSAIPSRRRSPGAFVRFLCASYLGEHKGIPSLLDAMTALAGQATIAGKWSMTIAGDGHLADFVEAAIKSRKLTNCVTFVGRRPRTGLMSLLSESDVVVLPSTWPENEPVILLEATASGAALIASRAGGNAELVQHGKTGLLFTPGDADALAAAMSALIRDPKMIEDMSRLNLNRRPTMDEGKSVRNLESLLRDCPSAKHPSNPVIICDGRADFRTNLSIQVLAKALPHPRPRLIWREWAESSDWDDAHAYWRFSDDVDTAKLAEPIERGVPMILPYSEAARALETITSNVHLYNDSRALWSIIQALTSGERVRDPSPELIAMRRRSIALRPQREFYFGTGL